MRKTLPSAARSGIASASRPFAGAPPRNTVPGGLPVHFGLTPSDRQLAPTGPPLPVGRADRGRCSSQGRTGGGAGSTCHHGPRAGVPGPRGLRLGGGAPAAAAHFRHAALQIRMLARGCTCGSELATRHLRACEGPYASGRKCDYARYVISTASAINVEFTSAGGGGCVFWQQHIETL